MNMFAQWNVEEHLHKCAEAVVHHGLAIAIFSVLGFVAATLVHRWKQAKYGTRVVVRVCWIEDKKQFSQVIGSGDALTMTGSKDVAASLVKAAKRCGIGKMIKADHWSQEQSKRCLRRICEGIAERFATGAIARAMHDKDVTVGEFLVGAFRRENTVSVILATREDLYHFLQPGSGTISGTGPELAEISQMFPSVTTNKDIDSIYRIDLYQ